MVTACSISAEELLRLSPDLFTLRFFNGYSNCRT